MSKPLTFFRHPINRNIIVALHDAVMAATSFVLALYLRLGKELFDYIMREMFHPALLFTVIALSVFVVMRLYRGLWRFASTQDLVTLTKAVTIAIGVFYLAMFFYNRLYGIPRSVPFIQWLLLLAMLGGPRFAYRMFKDFMLGRKLLFNDARIPVLLVGVNKNAELFLRDIERNPHTLYRAVGILDEHPRFHGQMMYGLQIYSGLGNLSRVLGQLAARGLKPQRILVADERLQGEELGRLLDAANDEGVLLARLPRLTEFKSGIGDEQEVRPIAVEDLLGRAQTSHDKESMRTLVEGRHVLVTGAGGSIGSELARQIASFSPASLTLVEQSEYNLYQIDAELAESAPGVARVAVLADVRDEAHIERLFATAQPEIVFHAAAIKHVPLAEYNREEAILTNVFGTKNIADACVRHDVSAMVLISTDKAVNPANVMGATKRLAECYCQALGSDEQARGQTRFITVRFGNVLGSTGSVVPLFEKQLKKGGPITITHPDMTRYFMTIREAVALVLQAAALGVDRKGRREGLIFVVDMGQPVRIEELAIQMIRLAGLKPHEDIRIVYTGLRPGEKLYEELFYDSETSEPTGHQGVLIAACRQAEWTALQRPLVKLHKACVARERETAYALLRSLVPEFQAKSASAADS